MSKVVEAKNEAEQRKQVLLEMRRKIKEDNTSKRAVVLASTKIEH